MVASKLNFEESFLSSKFKGTKPYNALANMKNDMDSFKEVGDLLDALIDFEKPIPNGAIEWNNIENLKGIINGLNA